MNSKYLETNAKFSSFYNFLLHLLNNLFKIHGFWNPNLKFHGFRGTHANVATASPIFILLLGEEGLESGIRDEISDRDGKSFGWLPRIKLTDCVHRGIFRLRIQMLSVNTVKTYFSYIVIDKFLCSKPNSC